jgi:hypothetical protein
VPVVVELFTSEGCSSCPSADEALLRLETAQPVPGVEVIALGQHVDYWNRLGWKDVFSAPAYTQRQRRYAEGFRTGSYTPQAVVNGQYEFVGSRTAELAGTVAKAARAPQATVSVAAAGAGLQVRVSNLPAGTKPAEVLLAITESGLASKVGRGENAGRELRHAAVVRELRPLGPVGADGAFSASHQSAGGGAGAGSGFAPYCGRGGSAPLSAGGSLTSAVPQPLLAQPCHLAPLLCYGQASSFYDPLSS